MQYADVLAEEADPRIRAILERAGYRGVLAVTLARAQARGAGGQSEGTGLGLALCQRFVELHGGTIRVESQVGRGSIFTVALPVRQPAPPADAPDEGD